MKETIFTLQMMSLLVHGAISKLFVGGRVLISFF